MFGLGIGELVLILIIVLIIFGAGKLPEIGEGLGRGIRSFRKAVRTPDEIDITPPKREGESAPATGAAAREGDRDRSENQP
jgi:sec-independent protein translocase protein TatA